MASPCPTEPRGGPATHVAPIGKDDETAPLLNAGRRNLKSPRTLVSGRCTRQWRPWPERALGRDIEHFEYVLWQKVFGTTKSRLRPLGDSTKSLW